ncbi:hypothetical protein [Sphingopyxis sp. LK2115]|uniref:hypothetical protein n=1 Tax=Sphingopyxis sp. LK2115 TaxID=2744558 RepID=UPI0016600A1E|nr:hypothetical protein [Sphingopyxis sp. LK2115]
MADQAPPSRYSVVERGGRLVVIDRETGQTPPTAAERMAEHDSKHGVEPIRPTKARGDSAPAAVMRAETGQSDRPAPTQEAAARPENVKDGRDRLAAVIAGRNKRPWNNPAPGDRPAPHAAPTPARIASRPAPRVGGARKTIVTGKWWDAKGPRTVELDPRGQAELTGAFLFLFLGVGIAAIVALFIAPVLLFVGAFLLFRFGDKVLAPIGAGIIDKALAAGN